MESEKLCGELEETTENLPTSDGDSDLPRGTAVPKTSPTFESDADDSWEDQLNICKERIEELQEEYSKSYLEIGKVLIQAREIYKGHGNWNKWLKENISFSVRHAQRLIRTAEMFDNYDREYRRQEVKITPPMLISCFFPYTKEGILNLLNHEICCDFTHMLVTEGLDLDSNTAPLCGAI